MEYNSTNRLEVLSYLFDYFNEKVIAEEPWLQITPLNTGRRKFRFAVNCFLVVCQYLVAWPPGLFPSKEYIYAIESLKVNLVIIYDPMGVN